jgi:hypothetical protein
MNSNAPLLIDRLRKLCDYAQAAGADRDWLAATADALVEVVLAQRIDPRHRRSLAKATTLAISVEAMQRSGFAHGRAVSALRQRHGLSRSRVYALLSLCPATSQDK